MSNEWATNELREGDRVCITLSDTRSQLTYYGELVKRIPNGLSMNGQYEDTCVVVPDGCMESIIISFDCVARTMH